VRKWRLPVENCSSRKANYGNGEEVERTWPSPALKFPTLSPRRLRCHFAGDEKGRLFNFEHIRADGKSQQNDTGW